MAIQNILSSKMRSFLTMLGIIIGIASVMVIIGLGNGMQGYMTDTFQSLGSNTLAIQITGVGSSRSVSTDDMYEIVKRNPGDFIEVTPTVPVGALVKIGRENLSQTSTTGVGEAYFSINNNTLREGRGLLYMDIEGRKKVCVIGWYLADQWFRGDAVGETIRIGGNSFTIVGVLEAEEEGSGEGGADDVIFIPYTTASRMSSAAIRSYTVTIVSEDRATESKKVMEDELFEILRNDDAFMVISMTQILDIMSQMLDVVITVLAVIAGISLVVGGIGIMNIMLVSVSERTREIGIRKALGAKERYILTQFVIEAAVTSAIGGIIGIGMGYAMSSLASALVTVLLDVAISVTPSTDSIILAVGASAAIGIVFGFLPARKAANLNPIDALRYE